jgi:transcriptional regulator with XRE-family HTH domain
VAAVRSHAADRDEAQLLVLLKELRQSAGLRQQDLAERLGRPQSFVSKYESGERRLDVVDLIAVCRALGTSLHEFAVLFEERNGGA